MNTKELVQQGYDFFGKGDMEGFMGILHDDVTWVFPGESHPLSGSHKGK
jgi:ketosteroid isomerase-like protein